MSSSESSTGEPLPPDLAARVESELADGERLVWVGQPLPGLYRLRSIPLLIVGIFFLGFSVLWLVMTAGMGLFAGFGAAQAGGGPAAVGVDSFFGCFALVGLFPLAIGIFLVTSPLWMGSMARKTLYAVTNRRAIIFEPQLFRTVQVRSYTASGLGAMARVERGDGAGDLVFEEYVTRGANNSTTTQRRGFLAVPRVREVEGLVRRTLLSSQGG
jgi:hypothetical protein